MPEMPELSGPALAVVMLALGVLNCFLGFRWFKIMISTWGLLLGAAIFGGAAYALTGNTIVAVIGGVIGGALGLSLLLGIYFTGVFVVGFLLGGVVAMAALTAAAPNLSIPAVGLIAVAAGLLGGGLALVLQRLLIIVATAVVGACQIVTGIWCLYQGQDIRHLLTDPPPSSQQAWLLLGWAVLALIGAAVQFRGPQRTIDKPAAKPKDGGKAA